MDLHELIFVLIHLFNLSGNGNPTPKTKVALTTKIWAREITWSLGTCTSSKAGTYKNNKIYTKNCFLASGTYDLKCQDTYGDGWNGGFVTIKGKKYCDKFESGKLKVEKVTI